MSDMVHVIAESFRAVGVHDDDAKDYAKALMFDLADAGYQIVNEEWMEAELYHAFERETMAHAR